MNKQTKVNSSNNADWEEIEKNLADYPELAEHEEEIRKRAALQRLLRFAAEHEEEIRKGPLFSGCSDSQLKKIGRPSKRSRTWPNMRKISERRQNSIGC
jgi:hypothetical protein